MPTVWWLFRVSSGQLFQGMTWCFLDAMVALGNTANRGSRLPKQDELLEFADWASMRWIVLAFSHFHTFSANFLYIVYWVLALLPLHNGRVSPRGLSQQKVLINIPTRRIDHGGLHKRWFPRQKWWTDGEALAFIFRKPWSTYGGSHVSTYVYCVANARIDRGIGGTAQILRERLLHYHSTLQSQIVLSQSQMCLRI